ncbi:MAG: NAD(P)H-binding protein [bacterium]
MTILIAGATGALGGAIARKLLTAGVPVRALGRNTEKLAALALLGADTVQCDLLDAAAVDRACDGVDQICSTANNVLGRGANSPNRVDLQAHRNLCDAAKRNGVRRIVYISGRGVNGADTRVDFFRVKYQVEQLLTSCGIPWVILSASAFMDIWVPMIGDGIVAKNVAMIFGDGTRLCNYIAVSDVAEVASKVLQRDDIRNEVIGVGGPSTVCLNDLATLIERELGVSAGRRRLPVAVLRWGGLALRPFHEVASRMMLLGHFAATHDTSFDDWQQTMRRFDVSPMTLETFVAAAYPRDVRP